MHFVQIVFAFTGGVLAVLLLLFSVNSFRESRPRAAIVSFLLFLPLVAVWIGLPALAGPGSFLLLIPTIVALIVVLLFFLPLGHTESLRLRTKMARFDERDVIFAREEYHPGAEKYDTYYQMRPDLRETDDRIRQLPELLAPGGRYFDAVDSPRIDAIFDEIEEMGTLVDGSVHSVVQAVDAAEMTARIKSQVLSAGACDVGIAPLNQAFVYTHVGRGPEPWGQPIENNHLYVIVFTLEMRYGQVEQAPHLPITEESAAGYHLGARISIELAEMIRKLGYPARAHIAGSNYQIIMPAVAHAAGLGELGRLGYLITPRFGSRVRLGAVTTDLPLVPDNPIEFGVQDFCAKCLKCATNCPSGAIPTAGKVDVRGVEKWQLDVERCLRYWRLIGTDCGLCMRVCPFSHPSSLLHDLVRSGIRRSAFARTISVSGDDLFYGRKLKFK